MSRNSIVLVGLVCAAGLLGSCARGESEVLSFTTEAATSVAPTSTGVDQEPGAESAAADHDIVALLPATDTQADVLGVPPASTRIAELAATLEAAVAADPDWFAEYAGSAPAGAPLPYDQKFGLTEDEYAEFLSGAVESEPGVVARATIGTAMLADDRYELSGSTATGGLAGIIFDAETRTFETPYGVTGPAVPWTNPGSSSFVGAADGWEWEYVDPEVAADLNSASRSAIKITLAVRAADGRVYLSVRGSDFDNGEPVSPIDVDLLYSSDIN